MLLREFSLSSTNIIILSKEAQFWEASIVKLLILLPVPNKDYSLSKYDDYVQQLHNKIVHLRQRTTVYRVKCKIRSHLRIVIQVPNG